MHAWYSHQGREHIDSRYLFAMRNVGVFQGDNPLAVYSCGGKIQVKILGFRDSIKHK